MSNTIKAVAVLGVVTLLAACGGQQEEPIVIEPVTVEPVTSKF